MPSPSGNNVHEVDIDFIVYPSPLTILTYGTVAIDKKDAMQANVQWFETLSPIDKLAPEWNRRDFYASDDLYYEFVDYLACLPPRRLVDGRCICSPSKVLAYGKFDLGRRDEWVILRTT